MEKNLEINDNIRLKNSKLKGTIIRNNNDSITAKINSKIIKTNSRNVEKIEINTVKKESKINIHSNYTHNFDNELMLRHKTKDEALFELETFIKDAYTYKASEIRIVHGKSGGILRTAVHDYLKKCKYIDSFRLGNYYEGQYGVTIAKIKL